MHRPSHETLSIVQSVAPQFLPDEEPVASIKCDVWRGTIDSKPVIAKVLRVKAPVWEWFFARETLLYQRFLTTPPPIPSPKFLAADLARHVLLLERMPGPALALGRYATTPLDEATVQTLLAHRAQLNAWNAGLSLAPMELPSPSVIAELRDRLLEDPTAPINWILEGTERCCSLGILTREECRTTLQALELRPTPCFSHGDFLLRNILRNGDALVPVDWECAGPHHEAWDAALLWVALPSSGRVSLEQSFAPEGTPAHRSLLGCIVWALARELKFRRFKRKEKHHSLIELRLYTDLQHQLTRLA